MTAPSYTYRCHIGRVTIADPLEDEPLADRLADVDGRIDRETS